jgi:hypothetical protein
VERPSYFEVIDAITEYGRLRERAGRVREKAGIPVSRGVGDPLYEEVCQAWGRLADLLDTLYRERPSLIVRVWRRVTGRKGAAK